MKHLLAILCLLALPVLASTNYLCIVYSETLKDPDKTISKVNSKSLFQDQTEAQWSDMALFWSIADTSVLYRVVCYNVDVGTVKKAVTKKNAEDNIKDKVSEKDKVNVVAAGMDVLTDLASQMGIEPRRTEAP